MENRSIFSTILPKPNKMSFLAFDREAKVNRIFLPGQFLQMERAPPKHFSQCLGGEFFRSEILWIVGESQQRGMLCGKKHGRNLFNQKFQLSNRNRRKELKVAI